MKIFHFFFLLFKTRTGTPGQNGLPGWSRTVAKVGLIFNQETKNGRKKIKTPSMNVKTPLWKGSKERYNFLSLLFTCDGV